MLLRRFYSLRSFPRHKCRGYKDSAPLGLITSCCVIASVSTIQFTMPPCSRFLSNSVAVLFIENSRKEKISPSGAEHPATTLVRDCIAFPVKPEIKNKKQPISNKVLPLQGHPADEKLPRCREIASSGEQTTPHYGGAYNAQFLINDFIAPLLFATLIPPG
ncbi:hypothetical protein [Maribellus luteus]|uniref:hypothetical protein n=1 Tax=Maribellus luteus TaxID=2305463 RepID=UPI0011C3E73B|nr:hypothetical protein [Maribellus luteus]